MVPGMRLLSGDLTCLQKPFSTLELDPRVSLLQVIRGQQNKCWEERAQESTDVRLILQGSCPFKMPEKTASILKLLNMKIILIALTNRIK